MNSLLTFVSRRRGTHGSLHWTDWVSYAYLCLGTIAMLWPVAWLVLSSFKSEGQLQDFPASVMPYSQVKVDVAGMQDQLPLFNVKTTDGTVTQMVQIRRVGITAEMAFPNEPGRTIEVNIDQRQPVTETKFAWGNYRDLFHSSDFVGYAWNSIFITAMSTIIVLFVNSLAAFALSKYEFRGRSTAYVLSIATLMIPPTIVLVPLFLVVNQLGLLNTPWGIILPGAATPAGVFLLRQYMLTIPDDLLDAARLDAASEWKIYWRIVLPLAAPALAVLAVFAIVWRWNDFLWPLIVLTRDDQFTLQLALNSYQGEPQMQWSSILAMTVLTLLPIACVFTFLQRYIQTGIAETGIR
ncbi:carbohydrate ABC transporter membrane protein 2, CUT1 family [Arboricoccus pini]|uniref:Carbohydrate ABC transporter membrane protein 2, CUT1 family n=1 Tax=Arboricoccus pini TaxID=1963835 RepID=A0A212R857_9PROT|nr:carbohydrate ABC transporter permease [Arboricoccus pini]SNB68342.1 carbohydrate ABC transporter membrane protein 2, CUT1 family [Arboricoccus pini]